MVGQPSRQKKLPLSLDLSTGFGHGDGGGEAKISNQQSNHATARSNDGGGRHRSHFCQYPLSLNPNVRRRQSTMVSKAYNPYRLVWRWNSCIYTSILLLLAIQVKHCKFAVHLHINIWKIESNPSPLQPLFFERQLLQPSRWVILQRRGLHVSHVNSTAGWYAEYYIPYLSCK